MRPYLLFLLTIFQWLRLRQVYEIDVKAKKRKIKLRGVKRRIVLDWFKRVREENTQGHIKGDQNLDVETANDTVNDKVKHVKFSKQTYSENPDTKKAHFSADSSFFKRKHYEPPPKCRPKKTEVSKEETITHKPGPVFVQVSTMKPRDIFGLESIEFDDDISRSHTSVSLVSRGAECIMLSKDFYVKHANEAVKKRVREFVRPYPDEHVFQDNLQIKEDWVMYKRVMLNDLTSQLVDRSNRFCS